MYGEYPLPSEHDFSDQFSGHARHPHYSSASTIEHLRRDGTLPQQATTSFAFTATNHPHGARFVPDRGVASDPSRYVPSLSLAI